MLQRVEGNSQVEDDALVEVKADWPKNHADAARRIAAHANSAGGSEILWLIGVDEKAHAVRGATGIDSASWYDQVTSHFESRWAPTLRTVIVPWRETTVVALLFGTDGAPYVVKHGDRLEVPWRGSTQTRSAHRHELLRILSPLTRVPDVELLGARLVQYTTPSTIAPIGFRLVLSLYLAPADERRVVMPFHRMNGVILTNRNEALVELDAFGVDLKYGYGWTPGEDVDGPHVKSTEDEVIVTGPCRLRLLASGSEKPFDSDDLRDDCVVSVNLSPAGLAGLIGIRGHFVTTSRDDAEDWAWLYVHDDLFHARRRRSA